MVVYEDAWYVQWVLYSTQALRPYAFLWSMEKASSIYRSLKDYILSVIEWRSPATAPYFMLINTAFWYVSSFVLLKYKMRFFLRYNKSTFFSWAYIHLVNILKLKFFYSARKANILQHTIQKHCKFGIGNSELTRTWILDINIVWAENNRFHCSCHLLSKLVIGNKYLHLHFLRKICNVMSFKLFWTKLEIFEVGLTKAFKV